MSRTADRASRDGVCDKASAATFMLTHGFKCFGAERLTDNLHGHHVVHYVVEFRVAGKNTEINVWSV